MSIFNSLGSNYDFGFVIRTITGSGKEEDSAKLKKFLEEKYNGKAVLTYKGREALRLALRASSLRGATVGICGFTCFAVYEAIIKEGYKVEYLDIEKDTLNFSLETLKHAVKKNPKLKIIFIQNTLGYACDMENISKFCKDNNIILVEDLAHSIGAKYSNGKEAGTVGDFTMLSFSQDKAIDRVSGGALIVRNDQFQISNFKFLILNKNQQIKDRLYPLFALLIRKMYGLGIGKLLHFFLKKVNVLSNPMNYIGMEDIYSLPSWYAKSIISQFEEMDKNITHRQMIASIYSRLINNKILLQSITSSINRSSNLRFPIFVNNRTDLVSSLKKAGIFVSDIWYDVPIAPRKYLDKTNYKKGSCPNSEEISEKILNLPTHKNVSENDARKIAQVINLWLESQ